MKSSRGWRQREIEQERKRQKLKWYRDIRQMKQAYIEYHKKKQLYDAYMVKVRAKEKADRDRQKRFMMRNYMQNQLFEMRNNYYV